MIDDELRTLLAIEPSPGFEARVRARVTADGPCVRWRVLSPGLAIAATLVVALAGGVLPRIARQATPPQTLLRTLDARPVLTPLRAAVDAPSEGTVRPSGAMPSHRSSHTSAPTTLAVAAEVHVDRAEALALQRLFAAPAPGAVGEVAPPHASEIVIPRIAIEPLTLDSPSQGVSQ